MLLKTCYECGNKSKNIQNGICENCLKKTSPIKNIKKPNFKICNFTKKIFYENRYFELFEIEKMLKNMMKKNITLNEGFKIDDIEIKDLEVVSNFLNFDLEIEYSVNKY